MIQALDAAPPEADTLILDYFPDLLEHIELVTRIGDVKLKRIIFPQASRTHGYFLSSNAHARLDMFDANRPPVLLHDDLTKDLTCTLQEGARLLRPRGDRPANFRNRPSSRSMARPSGSKRPTPRRISGLVDKLTGFFGHNLGVLTGGGGGVMRLATDQARAKGALTGACFPRTRKRSRRSSAWISSHVSGIVAPLPAKMVRGRGLLRLQRRRRRHPRGNRH